MRLAKDAKVDIRLNWRYDAKVESIFIDDKPVSGINRW